MSSTCSVQLAIGHTDNADSRFNSALAALRRTTHDGVYDTHTNLMFYPSAMQPTHARWEQVAPTPPSLEANGTNSDTTPDSAATTLFPPIPSKITRNFLTIDTLYTAPPLSNIGYPGPDALLIDPTAGSGGLSSIPANLLDELPAECRAAFDQALRVEEKWKNQWDTEASSAMRGALKVGFNGYPV